MDFPAPREIVDAISRRVAAGIFGYTIEPESYFEAAISWLSRRHAWTVPREWLASAPGVVPSIVLAITAYSRPGDAVIIQPPVYHPFAACILNNGRQLVLNPLKRSGTRYVMDFDGLERCMGDRTRLLILSSPHNPVGRVWSREELAGLAGICSRRGVIVISDEIHHDLVMEGFRHVPFASISDEAARISVTLFAPTKTFNIAGLSGSFVLIADGQARRRFLTAKQNACFSLPHPISLAAHEAAYRQGEAWLEELLLYIKGNYEYLVSFMKRRMPGVTVFPLEATYLAWLDMGKMGLSDAELKELLLSKAGVWLEEGASFGIGGEGFQRMNIACPRALLAQAAERIAAALA
jgi:cystathionine beta-lyase